MIEIKVDSLDQLDKRTEAFNRRIRLVWNGEEPIALLFKPYIEKRSRAQNALYWKWMGILADEFTQKLDVYNKDDIHELMVHKFLGTEDRIIVGTVIKDSRIRTSRLDRGSMAKYMGKVEAWAADMGVLLPVPAENEYAKYRELI